MKHWTPKKTESEYVDTARIGKKITAQDVKDAYKEVHVENIKL